MSSWHSYSKIYALGHPGTARIFSGPVTVEEKVDGSQLSFGIFDGQIRIKSKNREFDIHAPHGMFEEAAEAVQKLAPKLHNNWTYRGEYLRKPKHNHLTYARIPINHIAIFDIGIGNNIYLPYKEKFEEATRIGLETVPRLHVGHVQEPGDLYRLMQTPSFLGGPIEGFVIKNYSEFSRDGKTLMAKYVSETFKERAKVSFKKANPGFNEYCTVLIQSLSTEAAWRKAVQHCRERDELVNEPKDIAVLIKELLYDVERECMDEVKEQLWKFFWARAKRQVTRGFPEWYKKQLLESAFE